MQHFLNAPGVDAAVKATMIGLTPMVQYDKTDTFLMIAAGQSKVVEALYAMDKDPVKKSMRGWQYLLSLFV